MKSLHNIEKSGFRRGEYVGYADGVWIIKRYASGEWAWRSQPQDSALYLKHGVRFARTLEELSRKLDSVSDIALRTQKGVL